MSLNASFCYADTLQDFKSNCRNPAENKSANFSDDYNFTKKWIVANMFQNIFSNDLIKFANNASSNIEGIIFISDQQISSEAMYEHPTLIAAIDEYEGSKLSKYSYNSSANQNSSASDTNTSSASSTVSEDKVVRYTARMNHLFMQRCGLLKELAPFFFAITFIFFVQFAAWMALLAARRETTYPVQRLLAFIPAIMSLMVLMYGLEFDTCPWVGSSPDQAYLKMGKVCTVTFSYTFIHAVFYVLCHGWSITDQ